MIAGLSRLSDALPRHVCPVLSHAEDRIDDDVEWPKDAVKIVGLLDDHGEPSRCCVIVRTQIRKLKTVEGAFFKARPLTHCPSEYTTGLPNAE